MQLEASMETALIQVASHYINVMQAIQDERDDAFSKLEKIDAKKLEKKIRTKLEKVIRQELENEIRKELEQEIEDSTVSEVAKNEKEEKKSKKAKTTKKKTTQKKPEKKKSAGGMFGGPKKVSKKYEGEKGGKVDWFLKDALDTVYDPHGTGKPIKAATILARSSEGNVRVRDVVRIYSTDGEEGISDLAWTSPLTKYIIEAFEAC